MSDNSMNESLKWIASMRLGKMSNTEKLLRIM